MESLGILALQNIPGIGDKTLNKILFLHDTDEPADPATPATPSDLYRILKEARNRDRKVPLPDIKDVDAGWAKALEILKMSEANDVKIVGKESPDYPSLLLQIENPPALLHVKGNIGSLNENCIAIIGTRKPAEYGIYQAADFGEKFAKKGFVVVSGLAAGIDAAAHEGTLNAKGKTIAVLAHGLHTIYPRENKKLAEKILENNGTLVSEYPWGKNSTKGSFIARDRIQSGLSTAVLVIETKEKGGTMHTVQYCNKQGRVLMVLAPPGDSNFARNYSGNFKLIKDGEADFILGHDEGSSGCFFMGDRDESIASDIVSEPPSSGFNRYKLDKKITVDEDRMKELLDCIHDFSAFPRDECSKPDSKGSLRNEGSKTEYPESQFKLIESQGTQDGKGTHQMKLIDFG